MSSKDGEFYPATVKDDLGKGKYVIECLVNKTSYKKEMEHVSNRNRKLVFQCKD